MPGQNAIRVGGVVVEQVAAGRFWVDLPNGHRLLAYAIRAEVAHWAATGPGDRVAVDVSPCDPSKGRLVMEDNLESKE